MKLLIDTLDGKTVEYDLQDFTVAFPADDVIYVDGEPCVLSTARSTEAEAMKEASALFCRLLIDGNSNIGWGLLEELNAWLEKWDTK